jgi:hypothetical protein
MIVPLYGFVQGDTIGLVVLAHSDTTGAQIVAQLSDAASVRVDPTGPWTLLARGGEVPLDKTVEELALGPFERVDLRRRP